MSKAAMQFIAVVGVHFPIPPSASQEETLEKAWHASMIRALSGIEPDVLGKAAEIIIDRRHPKNDGRWFPSVAECKDACAKARSILQAQAPPQLQISAFGADAGEWSSDRIALANDLMKTEMARKAAKEGWHRALWNFARRNGRLPASDEMRGVQGASRGFFEAYRLAAAGEAGPNSAGLRELGDKIIRRGQQLKAAILGDAA